MFYSNARIFVALVILACIKIHAADSSKKMGTSVAQQHFLLQSNQRMMMEDIRAILKAEKGACDRKAFDEIRGRLIKLEQLDKDRSERMDKLQKIVEAIHQSGSTVGSVFARWGREDCPANTSDILYSGSLGGSWYNQIGGATTYLCLPKNPQRLKTLPNSLAYLYGGEYDGDTFGSEVRNGDDIPCAVCQSKTGSQKMMIPARIECLPGWTKQYAGYLGTGHYGQKSSKEYICVDERPRAAPKGHHNNEGALVYSVKAVCGSLPCPPFKNGDTVTCVVCTK